MKERNALDRLNYALKDSGKKALARHAKVDQPIVFRDSKNRLVKKFVDGKIEFIVFQESDYSF